jgi:hypothetical protein
LKTLKKISSIGGVDIKWNGPSGYGKKKCWKVFEEHLLYGIGRDCFVQDIE